MTPEQRALRDAWLAELWPTCPELPTGEREKKREEDRMMQRIVEERDAEDRPQRVQNPVERGAA